MQHISNFIDFKKYVKGKRIAVLGLGITHKPLIGFLHNLGADITVFDGNVKAKLNIESEPDNVKYVFGRDYLEKLKEGYDVIFKTPGIRNDLPQLKDAVSNGAVMTSEPEMFFKLCPAPIIGITGSDGKTTTTTLIAKILEAEGYKVLLGGNIGTPLLDKIEGIKDTDKVVIELSSFQLQPFKTGPHTAVITNLSPNHLDWHINYEEYVDCKKNILRDSSQLHYPAKKKIVLNYDNADSMALVNQIDEKNADICFFSRKRIPPKGVWLENGFIYAFGEKQLNVSDIKLPGTHNTENYMAAIAAVYDLVSRESIYNVAVNFGGVEHRLEFIREFKGVKYYNDSMASGPNRTIAGLRSFSQKVILIAGGKDKGIPYDDIGEPIVQCVKKLFLIGATAEKINEAVKKAGNVDTEYCTDYNEMVQRVYETAAEGDIVLLSPASTSFDMFKNFEERGRLFKRLVSQLH